MWSSIIERLGILEADVKGCVSLVQSHGGPFRLRVIVWVPFDSYYLTSLSFHLFQGEKFVGQLPYLLNV
jgi:hypothetical protein